MDLPEEAVTVFSRTDSKFGTFSTADVPSPSKSSDLIVATPPSAASPPMVSRQIRNGFKSTGTHNQLRQSLYSYLPEAKPVAVSPIQSQSAYNNNFNPTPYSQQRNGGGSMNIPKESLLSTVPYGPYSYNNGSSVPVGASGLDLTRADSATMSETTNTNSQAATRQVSPSTLFGGVDALVESQDWWLRDQASLVLGFDNWVNPGVEMINGNGTGNGTGSGTANETGGNASSPDLGLGSDFYMPSLGQQGKDDWNGYS